jgi:hypothetical protein
MTADPRLERLGDELERAIHDQIETVHAPHPRPGRGRALVSLVAASIVAVLVGLTAVTLLGESSNAERSITTAAPPPIELQLDPAAATVDSAAGFSAKRFAAEVFSRLPMADSDHASCTSPSAMRFTCTADRLVGTKEQQFVFVIDQGPVLAGACRQRGGTSLQWECALNDAAVQDGMFDRQRFDELTS